MSDISRFFKHSSIYAIGNLINRIGAFLLLPVYTNYLTVGEYGTIELFYVVSSVVSGILAVGMAHATLRFYFDYENQSDKNASITTNYIGSFVVTILGVSLLSFFAGDLALKVFESDKYTVGIYIILATLVLELSSQICLAYIRAIEYSIFFVLISVAKLVIQVGVNTYLVIFAGEGVTGVLIGNFVTVFTGWIILTVFTLYRCGFKFHLSKFLPILKYCVPFFLSTVMAIISTNVDKFILNYMISLETLGIYALALKFSMILEQMIGEPFSKSYGAFRYTIMDNNNAAKIQADIVRYLLIVAVFSALGISLFVPDLLYIMSNESFWRAADIVPILMLASVIKLVTYPLQTGILFAKKTKFMFYFTTLAAVVSVIGNLLLIPFIGLEGACITLVLTEMTVLYFTNKYSQKFFPVEYEVGKLFKILAIGISLYLCTFFLFWLPVVIAFLAKICLVALFLIIIFNSTALTESEIKRVKTFIHARFTSKAIVS